MSTNDSLLSGLKNTTTTVGNSFVNGARTVATGVSNFVGGTTTGYRGPVTTNTSYTTPVTTTAAYTVPVSHHGVSHVHGQVSHVQNVSHVHQPTTVSHVYTPTVAHTDYAVVNHGHSVVHGHSQVHGHSSVHHAVAE